MSYSICIVKSDMICIEKNSGINAEEIPGQDLLSFQNAKIQRFIFLNE